jgi:hypothetical protein
MCPASCKLSSQMSDESKISSYSAVIIDCSLSLVFYRSLSTLCRRYKLCFFRVFSFYSNCVSMKVLVTLHLFVYSLVCLWRYVSVFMSLTVCRHHLYSINLVLVKYIDVVSSLRVQDFIYSYTLKSGFWMERTFTLT